MISFRVVGMITIMLRRVARSQNTQDSSMADNSALAAVNMTSDSDMHDATQLDEEEEQWHAFNPEEEEDGECHVFDGNETGTFTKDSNVSSIELVHGDETGGQISMVSTCTDFSGNNIEWIVRVRSLTLLLYSYRLEDLQL